MGDDTSQGDINIPYQYMLENPDIKAFRQSQDEGTFVLLPLLIPSSPKSGIH